MALDKFKSNINSEDLDKRFTSKWYDDIDRIRIEIIDDFCLFLNAEGFVVERDEYSAKATYQTAIISIEIKENERKSWVNIKPQKNLLCGALIKYNKWGDDVQLNVIPRSNNQPLVEDEINNGEIISVYYKFLKDVDVFKKYLDNFNAIKYYFYTRMENNRSKLSIFGKIYSTVNARDVDSKEFESIKDIVEAVLNDEFSYRGLW